MPGEGVTGAGVAGMENQACIRFDSRDGQRGCLRVQLHLVTGAQGLVVAK